MKIKKAAFNLKALIAIAIPVVVSTGEKEKIFEISNFKVFNKENQNYFSVDLINKSKGFLYGDFNVYQKQGSKKILVGAAIGVSSYIPKRQVSYALLEESTGQMLPSGNYELEFIEYSDMNREKGQTKLTSFTKQ